MLRTVAFAVAALACSQVLAVHRFNNCSNGHCYVKPVAKVVAPAYVPQTVIANQNVFYSVGQDVRYGATPAIANAQLQQVERDFQRAADRLLELKAYAANQPQTIVLQIQAAPQQQLQQSTHCVEQQSTTYSQSAPMGAILQNACAKCHTGANAKGDFHLDRPLDCNTKLLAIAKVVAGEMPPKQPLDREQTLSVVDELSRIPTSDGQPPPPTMTPGEHQPLTPPQDDQPEQPPQVPSNEETFSRADVEAMLKKIQPFVKSK